MRQFFRYFRFGRWQAVRRGLAVGIASLAAGTAISAAAATLELKDGRTLVGRFNQISGVAESPLSRGTPAGEVAVTPIVVVDDGLRRTYLHYTQVRQVIDEESRPNVQINLWQDVAERGGVLGRLGAAVRVTPFDEYGRRIYEVQTTDGTLSVVQGITQITPVYTRVRGLMGGPRPIAWDMRIATSSIPSDTLSRILATAVPRDDLDGRLQIVRFYLESERYGAAGSELEQIVEQFPERQDLQQDIRQLRQLAARVILKEIDLRGKAGQHQLARALLSQFPADGVAGETLQQVREHLGKYAAQDQRREAALAKLSAEVAKIEDANGRRLAEEFAQEIAAAVNEDAIGRLASFERLASDADMTAEQKAALAISGWLVGANQATDNFQVAVSLAEVRDKVVQYLREPLADRRAHLASELADLEGATVERVAQILKLMKPPLAAPPTAAIGPGSYELAARGQPEGSDVRYLVQLPPEYDPLRQYPLIITLGDAGVGPEEMLDYWAGPVPPEGLRAGQRLGQATRHGYITISIDWQQPHQLAYDYSAREHQVVLGALRHACRRFAIDTSRVFLTGHGIGGDAVWDIAIAHPDAFAGVIPFVARADRYVNHYAKNAPYVAWYVVAGELDGDKMARNAKELDRYLRPNIDATVVEYLGRGYEPFGDEIQRVFDWMARRQRTMPTEFEYVSMRPWDNFFHWVEVSGLPERSMVAPANWPPPRATRPYQFSSKKLQTNRLLVTARAERVTVWLSPELVDFDSQLIVDLNGRRISPPDRSVRPDLQVLLEDVRTRADRHRPFWAKLTSP